MSDEKTEQPTTKRLRDSRKKGDVAYSKDFTQTLLITALFGYLIFNGGNIVDALVDIILLPTLLWGLSFPDAVSVLIDACVRRAAALLLPFLLIVLMIGILGDTLQVGIVLAFEKLKPSGKKLNAVANLKQIFSKKNFVEFLKSATKIAFLTILVAWVIRDDLAQLLVIPHAGLDGAAMAIGSMFSTLLVWVALAYIVIALADLGWQRFQHRKQLMMTKSEVKREHKESEGDPRIKQKRKQLHKEMVMQGAVAASRKATVLVTNPTHYAIALYYEEEETPLPIVLAMGDGVLASEMIAAAREAGVPVMQNIPLAHALIAKAAIEQYIPSELIEPVAEVLRLVMQLRVENE